MTMSVNSRRRRHVPFGRVSSSRLNSLLIYPTLIISAMAIFLGTTVLLLIVTKGKNIQETGQRVKQAETVRQVGNFDEEEEYARQSKAFPQDHADERPNVPRHGDDLWYGDVGDGRYRDGLRAFGDDYESDHQYNTYDYYYEEGRREYEGEYEEYEGEHEEYEGEYEEYEGEYEEYDNEYAKHYNYAEYPGVNGDGDHDPYYELGPQDIDHAGVWGALPNHPSMLHDGNHVGSAEDKRDANVNGMYETYHGDDYIPHKDDLEYHGEEGWVEADDEYNAHFVFGDGFEDHSYDDYAGDDDSWIHVEQNDEAALSKRARPVVFGIERFVAQQPSFTLADTQLYLGPIVDVL